MISQSLPQLVQTTITIVGGVLHHAVSERGTLTMVAPCDGGVMLSDEADRLQLRHYFIQQQQELGKVNGYIEEMMNGQKVIKVFCHELPLEGFDELQRSSEESATGQRFANIIMPVNGQLGNLTYVLLRTGRRRCAGRTNGIRLACTRGGPFLADQAVNSAISQISMQPTPSSWRWPALTRIFALHGRKARGRRRLRDPGQRQVRSGRYLSPRRTSTPACGRGNTRTATARPRTTKLGGDIVMEDVDFGYTPDEEVLHDINLYAAGSEDRLCRLHRCRQDDHHQPDQPLLRHQDGKIRYDGININKIRKADLRRSLGIVLQDPPVHRHGHGEHPLRPTWMPPMRSASPRPSSPMRTASSSVCPTATTPC